MKDTKEGLPCMPTHKFKPCYWKTKGTKNSTTLQLKKGKEKENLIGIVCHINQLKNKSNNQHAVPRKTQLSGDCRAWGQPALWDPVFKKKKYGGGGRGQTYTRIILITQKGIMKFLYS